MIKKINADLIFIAAIFALSLLYLNGILHKGVVLNNVHYINDLAFVSHNTKEALKNNGLPLWTPYFYAGHPLLAIPENYMFDLNFLFILFFGDIYLAMNLALFFYLFGAGLGMYLLAYNLAENKKAAFISAIVFMFNGFVHSFVINGHLNILEGYALIPFIFLFVHKALKTKEWVLYSILAGVFFAMQIFSGSMILFFYTFLLVALYLAFNLIRKDFKSALLKTIFVGAIFVAVAISLAAVKLLPSLEFADMSSRAGSVSYSEFLGYPFAFKDIARVAVTSIGYQDVSVAVGFMGFMLLIFGLFHYRKRMVAFAFLVAVFSLLFASGSFVADAMYKVPGFDKLRHAERALVLFAFAGPVLIAYGFVLLSEKIKKYPLFFRYEKFLFALIVFLVIFELVILQKVPMPAKIVKPEEIKLLEHISNDNSRFRTINLAQKDIIGAAGYNYYAQKGISEAKGGGGIWVNDYAAFLGIAQQSLSGKIFGILNIKYIVSDKRLEAGNISLVDVFNQCRECAVSNAFGPYLYKNDFFLPRYYLVPSSILVAGNEDLAKQLTYSLMLQNFEPKNSVLVEGKKINDYGIDFLRKFEIIFLVRDSVDQDSIGKLRDYAASGGRIVPDILNKQVNVGNEEVFEIFNKIKGSYKEITATEYKHNKVVLELDGEKGWLVASERFAYFPGWKASINGNEIEMYKADNAVTAVYLNGEKGKLVFEYRPKSFSRGKLISLAAFFAILGYFGYFLYKKKFKTGDKNQA